MKIKEMFAMFRQRLSRRPKWSLLLLLLTLGLFGFALMLTPMFLGSRSLLDKVKSTQDYQSIVAGAKPNLHKQGDEQGVNEVIHLTTFVDVALNLTIVRGEDFINEYNNIPRYETKNESASPQLRYDNVILFSLIVLIICLTAFTFFSEKSNAQNSNIDNYIVDSVPSITTIDNSIVDSVPSITTVDGILQIGMIGAQQRAEALFSRSTLLLAGGIIMAFVGVSIFYLSLPNSTPNEPPTNYLPHAIRPAGILIFIESIAWFLLRQYRALIEDYKTFHRIYLKRANFLAAYKLISGGDVRPEDLFMAASLVDEDLTGRLKQGETTEALEHVKLEEASPVFALVDSMIKHGLGKRN